MLGLEIFPDRKFCRKFVDGTYEKRFNRAIFDILIYALAHPAMREWAKNNPRAFVSAFEGVSIDDDFRRSVETTTKSILSTRTRFSLFLNALQAVSDIKLEMPALSDGSED